MSGSTDTKEVLQLEREVVQVKWEVMQVKGRFPQVDVEVLHVESRC